MSRPLRSGMLMSRISRSQRRRAACRGLPGRCRPRRSRRGAILDQELAQAGAHYRVIIGNQDGVHVLILLHCSGAGKYKTWSGPVGDIRTGPLRRTVPEPGSRPSPSQSIHHEGHDGERRGTPRTGSWRCRPRPRRCRWSRDRGDQRDDEEDDSIVKHGRTPGLIRPAWPCAQLPGNGPAAQSVPAAA